MSAPEQYVEAGREALFVTCTRRACAGPGGAPWVQEVGEGTASPAELQEAIDAHVATHLPTIEEAAQALVEWWKDTGITSGPDELAQPCKDLMAAVERES